MTASLPESVRRCFARFVTTELTTIDSRQQPITWPVTPYYADGGPSIDVTTGLGYPKEADDARRNPRVALLFSDPTGSGVTTGIRVLVQGTATVDDSDPEASAIRYLKVRPERVLIWPEGDPAREPEILDSHVEEVRSGHVEEPLEAHALAAGGASRWDSRIDELGERHPMAVLSWVGPDGFPIAVRLPVAVDRSARRIRLGTEPAGLPLASGRACLAAHSHAPDLTWQESFQVRGDLVHDDRGWSLVPREGEARAPGPPDR